MALNVTIRDLLEAGVHFGHQTARWNPKMKKFIFEQRNGIYIIDLQKTMEHLAIAYDFIKNLVSRGQKILFVGTKKQAKEIIREAAISCGMYYVNERWLGGLLTNYATIRKSVAHYKDVQRIIDDGSIDKMPGKEASHLRREWTKMHRNLEGIKDMEELPAAVFVMDPVREAIAVREARKTGVQVVAIADTNCDPTLLDYPIPGNDDASRTIKLLSGVIADAVLEGKSHMVVVVQAPPVAAKGAVSPVEEAAHAARGHRPVKRTAEGKGKETKTMTAKPVAPKKKETKKPGEAVAAPGPAKEK